MRERCSGKTAAMPSTVEETGGVEAGDLGEPCGAERGGSVCVAPVARWAGSPGSCVHVGNTGARGLGVDRYRFSAAGKGVLFLV